MAQKETQKNIINPKRSNTSSGKKTHTSRVQNGEMSVTSKIRSVGNSKGVILSNQLLHKAGLPADADIIVTAVEGQIIIKEMKPADVNTDLTTWENQFKQAIKNGAVPENDLFNGVTNSFDENEWTA
jgi:antitoxin MazE